MGKRGGGDWTIGGETCIYIYSGIEILPCYNIRERGVLSG